MAPLQDAQRAIRMVRAMENKVHLLGFSAGGHLLGMAAARPDFVTYSPQDSLDDIRPTADSVGLIYPVITLEAPYQHTRTHQMIVGNDATPTRKPTGQCKITSPAPTRQPFWRRRRTIIPPTLITPS